RDAAYLDAKDQRSVRWNHATAAGAIGELRRNYEEAFATDTHALEPLIPARDHVGRADSLNREDARVELLAGVEPARVGDAGVEAGLCHRAGSHDFILEVQTAAGAGHFGEV